MSTLKLYDTDAYQTAFDATVLSCEKDEKSGLFSVVLDQTLFFPEEGGQTPDQGTLDGIPVADVQIDSRQVIFHLLNEPLLVHKKVHGEILWEHRFSNMQQHTGEHIFSGIVDRRFHFHNVGFHLSDSMVTMDYDGVLSLKDAAEVEAEANRAICANIPVSCEYPSPAVLQTIRYRSKIDIDGPVRLVTIPGYDVCACCAPHVHSTAEIGLLKVISVSHYKGGVRLSILCGFRALSLFCELKDTVDTLSQSFCTSPQNLPQAVLHLREEKETAQKKVASLEKALLFAQMSSLDPAAANVCLFTEDLSVAAIRDAVNTLTSCHTGYCAVFNGSDSAGYQYILGSHTLDSRQMGHVLAKRFQARGGGKPEMIQGSVSASREMLQTLFFTA